MVRADPGLDRRGGLASLRGERAYAGATRLFAGLHRRVARDIRAASGIGPRPSSTSGRVRATSSSRSAHSFLDASADRRIEPSAAMREIAADRGLTELDGRAEQLPLPTLPSTWPSRPCRCTTGTIPRRAVRRDPARPPSRRRGPDLRRAVRRATTTGRCAPSPWRRDWTLAAVHRRTLDERLLGVRPYSLITITP